MKITTNILIALAVIVAGLAWSQSVKTPTPTAQPPQPNPASRYQIVFSPYARADTFLLDTQTGRIWIPTEYTNLVGNPTAWVPQARIDNDQEKQAWVGLHQFREKP